MFISNIINGIFICLELCYMLRVSHKATHVEGKVSENDSSFT